MEVDENGKYRSMNDPVGGSIGYLGGDGGGGGAGGGVYICGKNMYKTNEKRRLEDLERYLASRRSTQQSSTALSLQPNRKDGGDDSKADTLKNEGTINNATINLDYDDASSNVTVNFIQEREVYRSLSATMPQTNRSIRFVRDKVDKDPAEEMCDLERDEECWVITCKPIFYARKAQSFVVRFLFITMLTTNCGVRLVSNKDGQDAMELCKLERDKECWDITHKPMVYGQMALGKTHTVFGEERREGSNDHVGLVQQALKPVFNKIASPASNASALGGGSGKSTCTTTKASFFEIYNERVYDLLLPNKHTVTDVGKGLCFVGGGVMGLTGKGKSRH